MKYAAVTLLGVSVFTQLAHRPLRLSLRAHAVSYFEAYLLQLGKPARSASRFFSRGLRTEGSYPLLPLFKFSCALKRHPRCTIHHRITQIHLW